MKKQIKIQSISDIITNSSSEVFLMHYDDAIMVKDDYADEEGVSFGSVEFDDIANYKWYHDVFENTIDFENSPKYDEQYKALFDKLDSTCDWEWLKKCPEELKAVQEIWKNWCEANKDMINEKIYDLVELYIEDSFENHRDAEDYAWDFALSHRSNH